MGALTADFLTTPKRLATKPEIAEITFITEGSKRVRIWRPIAGAAFMDIHEKDDVMHEHVTVILTDPDALNRVVTVNLTTLRRRIPHDPACVVHPGEIRMSLPRKSYALYERAQSRDPDQIAYGIAMQILRPKPPVTGDLLMRLRRGFQASAFADQTLAAAVRSAMDSQAAFT